MIAIILIKNRFFIYFVKKSKFYNLIFKLI